MQITKKLAHRSNYGIMRSVKSIKYIVIHYTANDGDKSYNNANYFQTRSNLRASAHYFVDDNNIYQSVEDNYIAYSVGGSKWADCSTTGGGRLYNKATNKNTLNIELCDTVKDGSHNVTQATINLAIELTKELMQKYNIPAENVIRHFDVNGKHCPAYWMDNTKWENEFHSKLSQSTPTNDSLTLYLVRKSFADRGSQLGAFANLDNAKKLVDSTKNYSVFDEDGNCLYSNNIEQTYSGGFPIIPPVLQKGSQGLQVVRLQKFLNWYYDRVVVDRVSLKEDGIFGNNTKKGVVRFQQDVFPSTKSEWDGKFGSKTLAKAKSVKK